MYFLPIFLENQLQRIQMFIQERFFQAFVAHTIMCSVTINKFLAKVNLKIKMKNFKKKSLESFHMIKVSINDQVSGILQDRL